MADGKYFRTAEPPITYMLHKFWILLLCLATFQSSVIAQDTKHDTIPGTKGKLDVAPESGKEKRQEKKLYSVSQFGRESFLFIRQPLRWKGKDWLKVGALVGTSALLALADQPLRNATQGTQRYYYSVPIVGGRVYGEWYSIGGVAGVFGLYGLIARDTAAKKISIELLQAGLYSEAVTELLKMAVGRARPYKNEGAGGFHPFTGLHTDYNSFPSGHSTSAFALSTIMSRHAHSVILKILAYVPAGFTLVSRIYQDKHWISDELIGAAIGYFAGNWVVDLHETKRHRINVAPLTN
jgi:membrane-associated phospholipid phosphatase